MYYNKFLRKQASGTAETVSMPQDIVTTLPKMLGGVEGYTVNMPMTGEQVNPVKLIQLHKAYNDLNDYQKNPADPRFSDHNYSPTKSLSVLNNLLSNQQVLRNYNNWRKANPKHAHIKFYDQLFNKLRPQVAARYNQAQLADALRARSGYTFNQVSNAMAAGNRLQAYQQGNHAKGYDPTEDMRNVSKFINNPKVQTNYNSWLPNNTNHPMAGTLRNVMAQRHAMQHAAKNPDAFKRFSQFRGMGLMDYLFGSAKDNYDLLRMANGPFGAFMNANQRNMMKNNYGLMKLIWRIKKFFSEFGNWKQQADPDDPQTAKSTR